MKELLYEIVESNTGRNVNQTFDVHIIDKDPVFTVVVKSKGPLRNPIYKYPDEELMDIDSCAARQWLININYLAKKIRIRELYVSLPTEKSETYL